MIVNTPVLDGDAVVGASVSGRDVTAAEDHLLRVLADYREALADGDLRTTSARARLEAMDSYLHLVEGHGRLADVAAALVYQAQRR